MFSIKAGKIACQDMTRIKRLVGDITVQNLQYVECYVAERLGIFIPSVGFCEYAITPSHTHPSYLFVIFNSKDQSFYDFDIDVPEEHYLAFALRPGVPHKEEASDSFVRYTAICINKDYFEYVYQKYNCGTPDFNDEWKQFVVEHEIMLYIKKFMTEFESGSVGCESILEAITEIICHGLVRGILGTHVGKGFKFEKYEIENIIEYMHQNFGEKITVEKLAQKANMSESHFIRVFKKATGLSPMDYLIDVRIEKAKKLLMACTKNISEISLLCGFNSIAHFSSSFSRYAGLSPSKYQNMYGNS